jgi:hypothetical protein
MRHLLSFFGFLASEMMNGRVTRLPCRRVQRPLLALATTRERLTGGGKVHKIVSRNVNLRLWNLNCLGCVCLKENPYD